MESATILVSGLPRSGTSMMMQMLHAGGVALLADEVRAADADNPRGYYELEAVKRSKQDKSWLDSAAGKAVKVIHAFLLDLPLDREYRVIFMRRNILEVLDSQQAMLARTGRPGTSLSRQRLAQVFERQIQQAISHLDGQPCFHPLDVQYRQVIEDPLGQADRINQFLGGHLDSQAMASAVDCTLYRQQSREERREAT